MSTECLLDVMQVCRNGHVLTDLLYTHPEQGRSHCDRCGAATLSRCPTCGRELPGAIPVPGFVPIGERRAPQHCSSCGAPFPWAERRLPLPGPAQALLESVLRRLPRAVRQLRQRHGDRPAFVVADEFDLQDVLRAMLHLHFDEVRPESRTPAYAAQTRTDFILGPERIAVAAKFVTATLRERQLTEQLQEDIAYYERQPNCGGFVGFLYDPEQRIHEPRRFETVSHRADIGLNVRCVVAS